MPGSAAVLVLEAHAKAAVPIIESCAALGLAVIAASSRRHCCGMYCRGTQRRLIYPAIEHDPDGCREALTAFLKRNKVQVLLPVGDVMTDLVAAHQDNFRQYTRLVLPPYEVFRQGRSKILTMQAALRSDCPIPRTWFPSEQPLKSIANEACWPVLIKPAVSAGARGIVLCSNARELIKSFPAISRRHGECFVQEYIPQNGMQYKADLLVDGAQNLLAGVAYAKLRYYPASGGSSVLNRTEHRPDIIATAHRLLRELGWVGFCDFDFITDHRDNTVKLMEINPRFPESYRATVAAGVDMTAMLYRMACGEQVAPQLDYRDGRYLRFLFGDIMWFLTSGAQRWKASPSFFSFYRPGMIYQLLRLRDWGPALGYLMENASVLWDSRARAIRFSRGTSSQP